LTHDFNYVIININVVKDSLLKTTGRRCDSAHLHQIKIRSI